MEPRGFRAGVGLGNVARRTLGIFLLLVTVMLWTGSNFLSSFIFADNTFSKPYFVTYLNTGGFAISLIPIFLRILYKRGFSNIRAALSDHLRFRPDGYKGLLSASGDGDSTFGEPIPSAESELFLGPEGEVADDMAASYHTFDSSGPLSIRETAKLSFEFCLLWFVANYLVSGCLEYTSVASSTILTSTSGIWTLIFGAIARVESFSLRKLMGVLASLAGIILISSVDLSSESNDGNRGSFPHKSQTEIAIGDAMAFASAVIYGLYTVVMKKRIGNEDRVNMPLFFGLVGLFNVILLWPGFFILHFTGVEEFQLPPTGQVWTIVLRLLLGICNVVDDPTGGDGRIVNDYTSVPDWADDS
ncbi:hypothetical protein B7463_g1418, partial [Scytalidium lignicola]